MRLTLISIFLFFFYSCTIKNNDRVTNFVRNSENSVFAVVKLSYNSLGDPQAVGGITGTAFIVNDSTVITAHHVLNKNDFLPNPGFKYVQYWLLKRGTKKIIELKKDYLVVYPNIETTIINLPEKVQGGFKLRNQKVKINDTIYNFGHITKSMPVKKAHWENTLIIDDYEIKSIDQSDSIGKINLVKKMTLKSNDVNLKDINCIQLSFIANQGMSGGPVITKNKFIGLMSFGYPPDSIFKKQVYAIHVNEILKVMKQR